MAIDVNNLNNYLPVSVRNFMAFRTPQRLALYKMLSALIKGSTPIDVCLKHLYDRKKEKKRPDAYIIEKWIRRMRKGDAFHDAIRDDVPPQERVLIACGSMSDNLAGGIDQAINATVGVKKIQSVLVAGLSWPIILLIIVFGMLVGFAKHMAPEFSKMLPESEWSGYSGALLRTSKYIDSYWILMVVAIVVCVFFFVRSLPRWTGEKRKFVDQYFPYKIYSSYNSASFLIALSSLLRAGVPIDGSLSRIEKNSSPWMSWHIKIMLRKMNRGDDPGEAMDTGLIDDNTTDQLYIYAKNSDFSVALKDLGEQAIENGIDSIKAQTNIGKTISIVLLGVCVLWMQLSMLDLQSKLASSTGNPQTQVK